MTQRNPWILIFIVVVGLMVSSCLPKEMPTQVVPTPTSTPQPSEVADSGGEEAVTSEAVATIEETVPEATPYDLTQLHATDPTTVNLASGQPTLVEFFAFW